MLISELTEHFLYEVVRDSGILLSLLVNTRGAQTFLHAKNTLY